MRMPLIIALALACLAGAAAPAEPGTRQVLRQGWQLQAEDKAGATGEAIARPGFQAQGWHAAEVPCTVMAALIKAGVHRNPFFGRNLAAIREEPFRQGWWYRTEFEGDAPGSGVHTRLHFDGLNFSADLWLNGKKIASRQDLQGAFRTFDLDLTPHLQKGRNALAVEVFPPKPGDFTVGFVDWNPPAPDRNMGLFREVSLVRTGAVALEGFTVRSHLDLKTLQEATLAIGGELVNREARIVSGTLRGTLGDLRFQIPFALQPWERKPLKLGPADVPGLRIRNPRVWWPRTLGNPELYTLHLEALAKGHPSDAVRIPFGIREVSDHLNAQGHRGYRINGKDILIRGAGWVDDLFLREDPENLAHQFAYIRHLNLNTIRLEGFWGASERIYELADREGVLVMVGWSCQWEWPEYVGKPIEENETFGGAREPRDVAQVTASFRDQVRALRNHPSILAWLVGSDKLPWPEVEKQYRQDLMALDPTRPLLTSCKAWTSPVSGPSAVKMAGPYDYVTPNYWWVDTQYGGAFGFNTETGPGPQVPPLASLKRMLPADKLWPINDDWNYHCSRFQFVNLDIYLKAFDARYGAATSVEDFALRAQMANYEAMRPMFESFAARRPEATGVIHWMLNGAWPKFYWQLYDTDLMPNGAFYGARKGLQSLSPVYDYARKAVVLVNDTLTDRKDLRVQVRTYGPGGTLATEQVLPVSVLAQGATPVVNVPAPAGPFHFLDLRVLDAAGRELANNFYWLSAREDVLDLPKTTWYATPNTAFGDLKGLKALPPASVQVETRTLPGEPWTQEVTLTNTSDVLAFGLELTAEGSNGEPLLPVLWEDNYLSLVPRERRVLRLTLPVRPAGTPRISLKGWNLSPRS